MSKLKIKAKILYPPGSWGLNKPVKNATVTIHDLDANGKDKIFTGTTDSQGRVKGTSKDWQDKKRIRYWRVTSTFPPAGEWAYKHVPDLTDVMVLTVTIKKGDQSFTGPFPFVGDNVEIPLVVPWAWDGGGTVAPHATVNGEDFTDFQKMINKTTKRIEAGDDLELELFGEWSEAMDPLVDIINKPPLELLQGIFPGTQPGSVIIAVGGIFVTLTGAEIAAIILAIGAMILLTGAAVFVTCLGIAVIAAIAAGYCSIEAGQETVTDINGQPTNRTRIKLSQSC